MILLKDNNMTNNALIANEPIVYGTKVVHKEYGNGTITKVLPDKIYVSFNGRNRIFPWPESFIKGYLAIIDTDIDPELLASNNSSSPFDSFTKGTISEAFSGLLDKYFNQFPDRWESEKYIWKAVQTFQDRWDPKASDLLQ